jgi:hypothetical protein
MVDFPLISVTPGGPGGQTPWVKLKDSSFSKVNGTLTNAMPNQTNMQLFKTGDTDDATGASGWMFNLNNTNTTGVVGGTLALGSFNPPISTPNNWKISLPTSGGFGPDEFLSYAKARKEMTGITNTNLSEVTGVDTIYYLRGSSSISALPVSADRDVIIIDGNLTITGSTPFNPTPKSIAFVVTGTLTISDTVPEVNGVFIANNVNLTSSGSSTTPLKIRGNLVSRSAIDTSPLSRSSPPNNYGPALFIVFYPKMYVDLLPVLSISTYEWKQLE